jgi:transcriptional regulator of acetoin/glycerol metabolism
VTRRTDTNREPRRTRASLPRLHVVRVLGFERPLRAGARHDLDGLTEVTIGGGDRDRVVRRGATLELVIADRRMSARHARLVRDDARWLLEDRGSRNGSFVNGSPAKRAPVGDGDTFELGRTAFVVAALEADGLDVDASALVAPIGDIATFSPAFARALHNLAKVSLGTRSIVIGGETGTGKEVLARAAHATSRRSGAFVAVNCGALPATLVESELFGYRKGAFSGATEDRVGLVRAAEGGTLFLDEIGDLPLATQAALLRVLQEHEVMPLGATRPISIDVRVIAASHRDLEAEVTAGRFREDLYARLAGFVVELPALRERRTDLGLLVAALLTRGGANVTLALEAGRALLAHGWPRNVRELDQALGAAVALANDGVIELDHLPASVRDGGTDAEPAPGDRRDVELRAALAKHGGNIAAVGRELGVARMQVHRWIVRYGIELDGYRRSRP